MNEWQIASWVGCGLIALFGFSFGVFWKIMQDVKKSAHARIDRIETGLGDYAKLSAVNGQYEHLSQAVNNLSTRIDNLIFTINGGKRKK